MTTELTFEKLYQVRVRIQILRRTKCWVLPLPAHPINVNRQRSFSIHKFKYLQIRY